MTSNYDHLITVAGWEERFIEGLNDSLLKVEISNLIVLRANEYKEATQLNIECVEKICEQENIPLTIIEFEISNNTNTWGSLEESLKMCPTSQILFDISTAPREIIWFVLHFLEQNGSVVDCTYSRPQQYGEWLSKDPGTPRFVFYHSGITKLSSPTALLIVSGFDLERAKQLINFFEPKRAILAIQKGEQFENDSKNKDKHINKLKRLCEIDYFELDTYAPDGGYLTLEKEIPSLVENYNVIATSLGPKPSAVALYRLQNKFKDIALCYVPSLTYNTDNYSTGYQGAQKINYISND